MKRPNSIANENGARLRMHASPGCLLLLLIFAGSMATSRIHAFSAKLSRPWELIQDRLVTTTPSKSRRFYRIRDLASRARILPTSNPRPAAATTSTSVASQADDSDGPSKDDGDSEKSSAESASLSSSEIFLAATKDGLDAHQNVDTKSQVNGAAYESAPGMWACRKNLFQLTRPSNFPGVVLLHLLGSYLSLSHSGQGHLFKKILFQTPTMWVVLAALLLTSSTSMVVSDGSPLWH